jgi:RNA polymerase sigma-70 factor (ECF subfamily)
MMSEELPAEALLARMARQDVGALGELYDRFAPRVFGLLTRILSHRGEAEDTLQQVFLRLWGECQYLDREGMSVSAWLVVTSRGAALERLRTHDASKRASGVPPDSASRDKGEASGTRAAKAGRTLSASTQAAGRSPVQRLAAQKQGAADSPKISREVRVPPAWLPRPREIELLDDRLNLLHKLIKQLPESQRAALEFAVFRGLSESEIAAELGEPLGRIRSGLRAAITFVKQRRRAVIGTWTANI